MQNIKSLNRENPEDSLLPKRREILEVIKDHKVVSFDFIRRRFVGVAPSTLHYDIGKLLKNGLIRKLGNTNGAMYTTNNKNL